MKRKPAIVVMGVAGCGKSTAGTEIARHLCVTFLEGDQLHPAANVEKMAAGVPLTDEDRYPWLEAIGAAIKSRVVRSEGVVAACSALKRAYRAILRERSGTGNELIFVYLSGSQELISERLKLRTGHFFPASLLDSQFATLEPPQADERHVVADLRMPLEEMIAQVMRDIEAIDA